MALRVYLFYSRQTPSLIILELVASFHMSDNHQRFWGVGYGHIFQLTVGHKMLKRDQHLQEECRRRRMGRGRLDCGTGPAEA